MKPNYFIILALIALLNSCHDDENANPDLAFKGAFEMDEFQCRIEPQDPDVKSVFVVKTYPDINFIQSDMPNEMEVQLDEFISSMMDTYIEVNNKAYIIAIESHEPFRAQVFAQEFHLDSTGFNMEYINPYDTGNIGSSISLNGNLKDGLLNVEFQLFLTDENAKNNLYLTGYAVGEKK